MAQKVGVEVNGRGIPGGGRPAPKIPTRYPRRWWSGQKDTREVSPEEVERPKRYPRGIPGGGGAAKKIPARYPRRGWSGPKDTRDPYLLGDWFGQC